MNRLKNDREMAARERVERASAFPTGDWLAPGIRRAYFGAVLSACLLIVSGEFVILIETLGNRSISGWWKLLTVLCAIGVGVHVLFHIRRAGPYARRSLDRASWVLFLLCAAELIVACWLSMSDPRERAIVTGMVAVGVWSSALATLLLGPVGERLGSWPRWAHWLAAVIAWTPGLGLFALFLV